MQVGRGGRALPPQLVQLLQSQPDSLVIISSADLSFTEDAAAGEGRGGVSALLQAAAHTACLLNDKAQAAAPSC